MRKGNAAKALSVLIVSVFLILQSGCSLAARLKQPIEDFKNATSVVSSSARLAYVKINEISLDEALREVQCTQKRPDAECLPKRISVEELQRQRTISSDGMKARLDALDSLDKYVTLLAEIANSNKPEKITEAANNLQKSIDKLADQITKLDPPSSEGEGDEGSAAHKANQQKFKASIGIFSNAIGILLSAIGNRKRDQVLKKAVVEGDKAVGDIIAGLQLDFDIFWTQKKEAANLTIDLARNSFNAEVDKVKNTKGARPDTDTLRKLREEFIDAVTNRDTIISANPSDALHKMQEAHVKLVTLANQPTEENFAESASAIQAYLSAATRLGGAIVKLHRIKTPANTK